ncbi:uncharacterized protein LOC118911010 [Manis pentadactyla]|uniref:uncharacterized protein LOC118911010 n=1 Tax=Manis pentadactyla TaxID=143292 RepID=UPI00255C967E|nr:uncharacterized protein LOC118911010 [Manis pentadactyla]
MSKQSRGLRRAPREGLIQRFRHWVRAQHRRLRPSARRIPKGCLCLCLQNTEDVEDLPPCFPRERPVWHLTEGSLEPGPEDGQGRPPAQSRAQVNVQVHTASSDPVHQVHLPPSGLEDLQPLEAEPEAPVPSQDPGAEPSEEPGVRAGATAAPEPEEGPPPATGPPPQAALAPGPASGEAPSGAREPTRDPAPLQAGLTPAAVLAPARRPRPCLDPLTRTRKLALELSLLAPPQPLCPPDPLPHLSFSSCECVTLWICCNLLFLFYVLYHFVSFRF